MEYSVTLLYSDFLGTAVWIWLACACACAEVIHGQFHAQMAHIFHQRRRLQLVLHEYRFGNFDFKALRRQP